MRVGSASNPGLSRAMFYQFCHRWLSGIQLTQLQASAPHAMIKAMLMTEGDVRRHGFSRVLENHCDPSRHVPLSCGKGGSQMSRMR